MKRFKKYASISFMIVLVLILSSCNKSAENEHLPGYCQTYSGFAATASPDLYELLAEQDHQLTYESYLTVISAIELEFNVDDPGREIDLGGIQCFQNLTSLTLIGQSFKDISEISALSNIQSLELRDTSVVSIDSFKNLSKINSLVISGTHTLQSVEGVGEMTKLTHLSLTNNGIVVIEELDKLVNLVSLDLSENEIRVFPSITKLDLLTSLNISYNNIYQLGDDLSGLSTVTRLYASHNEICDLSTMDDLSSLTHLDLSYNNLGCDGSGESPNFDSLENASNLIELKLDHNDLVSIEGLEGRNINLTTLYLNDNQLTDITPISEYTTLEELYIENNSISVIDDLSGMTELTKINLSNNNIVDFTDLLTIEGLTEVTLNNNNITTIPDISSSWPVLDVLNLHSNQLTDTSGVSGHQTLSFLILYNNGLTELRGISNLPNLEKLTVFDEEAEAEIPVEDLNPNQISVIRDSFNNVSNIFVTVEGEFTFGFPVEAGLEIYNSISGISSVTRIAFIDMAIAVIDENSIELDNLVTILVNDNNLTNLDFILGNPALMQVDASRNPLTDFSVFNGTTTSNLDALRDVRINNNITPAVINSTFIDLPDLELVYLIGSNITSVTDSFLNLPALDEAVLSESRINSITNSFISLPSLSDLYLNNCQELTSLMSSINNLPELILLNIQDSINLETINGSLNNFSKLDTFGIEPDSLVSIIDSLNTINVEGEITFSVVLNSGNIEQITRSFNHGNYSGFQVQSQTPLAIDTIIDDSFNDLTISSHLGLVFQNNDFKTITSSFKNLVVGNIILSSNKIEVINSSFTGSNVSDSIRLHDNRLTTVPSLNTVLSVNEINLSDNRLTTLSFLDGITGLTVLNISNQVNTDLMAYTLLSLDGVNNMPDLTDFTYNAIGVTEIDGLKNIGITDFDLSLSTNDAKSITSISPTSFANSLITNLDLDEHLLPNLDFLSNFTDLQILYIGIDTASLAEFNGLPFEAELNRLGITSDQNITDFSYISNYDSLTSLTLHLPTTTALNNLDGLAELATLSIAEENIETISNSFNDMPLFNPINFLDEFTNLTTIDQSFDMYGLPNHPSLIVLSSNQISSLTDSFNNVQTAHIDVSSMLVFADSFTNALTLSIGGNSGNLSPVFDANSFVNVNNLLLEYGDYSSYAFISNYSSLTDLSFTILRTNITNLVNDNIETLNIEESTIAVDSLNLDLGIDSTLIFNSIGLGTISIISDSKIYDINATNATIDLTTSLANLDLSVVVDEFILNAPSTTSVVLNSFYANDVTFNTASLSDITRTNTAPNNAVNSFSLNTNESALNVDLKAGQLVINDNNATDYTLALTTGNVVINSNQPDITVDYNGQDLDVSYDTLESLSVSGDFANLTTSSLLLNSIELGITSINEANLESSQSTFSINGTNVTTINLINNNLSTLTSNVPGSSFNLNSTFSGPLAVTILSNELNISAANVEVISLTNTSSVNTLDLLAVPTLNDLAFGLAVVGTINIDTDETTIDITGSTGATIDVVASNLLTTNLSVAASNVTIDTTTASLSGLINVNDLTIIGPSLQTATILTTSSVNDLTFNTTPLLDTVVTNDSSINSISLSTTSSVLDIDAVNTVNGSITGLSLSSAVLDFGINTVSLNVGAPASLSLEAIAGGFTLTGNTPILSIDNSSSIGVLEVDDSVLSTVIAGTSQIGTLNTNSDVANLGITGVNILNMNLSGDIQAFNISAGLSTNVTLSSTSSSEVTISTNSNNLDITATSNVVVTSSTLESSNISLSSNDIDFTLSKAALVFTLTGSASQATISGPDIDSLVVDGSTNINTLVLENVDISALDVGLSNITTLNVTTSKTVFSVTSNNLTDVFIDGDNLINLTINNTNPGADFVIQSLSSALTLNGEINDLTIDNNSLNSIDISNIDIGVLTLNTNNLAILDTLSKVSTSLEINTTQNNFNLTTEAPIVIFNGATNHTLDFTSGGSGNITLTTNVDIMNVTAANILLNISGASLSGINGVVDTMTVANSDSTVSFNLIANTLNYTDESATAFVVAGTSTISDISIIGPELISINTGTADIDTLNYTYVNNNTTLVTEAKAIDANTTGTATLDITYTGSITLDADLGNANAVDITVTNANILNITGTLVAELNIDSSSLTTINTTSTNISLLTYTYINNNLSLITASSSISLNTPGAGDATITYSGLAQLNLNLGNANDIVVAITNANSLDIEGTCTTMTLTGTNLNSLTTDSLVVSGTYQMNDTLITDLEFVSAELVNSTSEMIVNTLSNSNIESIIAKLDGTTINLVSPIVDLDIYNFYYNSEVESLTAQEVIDNVRYDGYRTTAINNAWAEILLNEYMDYLDETATKTVIDDQSYETVEFYFQSYLTEIGSDEATFGTQNSIDARAAITSTLAQPVLTITVAALNDQVTTSIEEDANTSALAEQSSETYTLNN